MKNRIIDGLLADFILHPSDKTNFLRARQLPLKDFEDGVVAAVAEASGSNYVVTRHVPDFAVAPRPGSHADGISRGDGRSRASVT